MRHLFIILSFFLFFGLLQAQETKQKDNQINPNVNSKIGVVDMKKILAQSKAYQSLVDHSDKP